MPETECLEHTSIPKIKNPGPKFWIFHCCPFHISHLKSENMPVLKFCLSLI